MTLYFSVLTFLLGDLHTETRSRQWAKLLVLISEYTHILDTGVGQPPVGRSKRTIAGVGDRLAHRVDRGPNNVVYTQGTVHSYVKRTN